MIHVEKLTKYYGETPAIKDVSFDVPEGEILGFLGPNGAGKTTTMRILTCHISPTSGFATIDGFDVRENSMEARARLGYLPESAPLYLDMTVTDYLRFMAEIKGYSGEQKNKYVKDSIEQSGLEGVANRLIGNLSKGYRQRVGIAQAILGEPRVLILDEPTVGLDPKQIIEIRSLIKSLAKNKTIIISTHILPEVSMICSSVVIINEGRVVASGTPEKLILESRNESEIVVYVSLGKNSSATMENNIISKNNNSEHIEKISSILKNITGINYVTYSGKKSGDSYEFLLKVNLEKDPRKEIGRKLMQEGYDILELHTKGLSLEDIFIKVISTGSEVA